MPTKWMLKRSSLSCCTYLFVRDVVRVLQSGARQSRCFYYVYGIVGLDAHRVDHVQLDDRGAFIRLSDAGTGTGTAFELFYILPDSACIKC